MQASLRYWVAGDTASSGNQLFLHAEHSQCLYFAFASPTGGIEDSEWPRQRLYSDLTRWVQQEYETPPGVFLPRLFEALPVASLEDRTNISAGFITYVEGQLHLASRGVMPLLLRGNELATRWFQFGASPHEEIRSSPAWDPFAEQQLTLDPGDRLLIQATPAQSAEQQARRLKSFLKDSMHESWNSTRARYLNLLQTWFEADSAAGEQLFQPLLACELNDPMQGVFQTEEVSLLIDESLLLAATRWLTYQWQKVGLEKSARLKLQPLLEAVVKDIFESEREWGRLFMSISLRRFANFVEVEFSDPGLIHRSNHVETLLAADGDDSADDAESQMKNDLAEGDHPGEWKIVDGRNSLIIQHTLNVGHSG